MYYIREYKYITINNCVVFDSKDDFLIYTNIFTEYSWIKFKNKLNQSLKLVSYKNI